MKSLVRIFLFFVALGATSLLAQPAAPASADAGFVPIFDGKTLAGWDGDPKYWRVEDGCLVGEITPATIIKRNTFIIWRGGTPRDFELKVEYRISAQGNSGINYRSVQLADAPWSLAGYQADIDGPDRNKPPLRHTGQNYEERGRTFLARRGEMVHIDATAKPAVIASLGDSEAMKAFIKNDDWKVSPHHSRQHSHPHPQRPRDGRRRRRRFEKPPLRRPHRRAGPRRPADESRVPAFPPETTLTAARLPSSAFLPEKSATENPPCSSSTSKSR